MTQSKKHKVKISKAVKSGKEKKKKKERGLTEPESARKRKVAARKIEGYIIQPKRWQRAQ